MGKIAKTCEVLISKSKIKALSRAVNDHFWETCGKSGFLSRSGRHKPFQGRGV
jgi:hypothetical protein